MIFQNAIAEIISQHTNYDDMPTAAKKILDCLKNDNWNGYAVPIINIAKKMGFVNYSLDLDKNISGFIAINPDLSKKLESNKIICVNHSDNLGHKRFTIAHEIAHYIFDFNENESAEYYDYYTTDQSEELEAEKRANYFAANLLMPR